MNSDEVAWDWEQRVRQELGRRAEQNAAVMRSKVARQIEEAHSRAKQDAKANARARRKAAKRKARTLDA